MRPVPGASRLLYDDMGSLFTANHLLTLFSVVGIGAALGAIRFGPLRFGAAGALFVGLMVSAWKPEVGQGMQIVQQIGLAFFVYTVGLSAGTTFFENLRKQRALLVTCVCACVLGAGIALSGGRLLGLPEGLTLGLFTGSLTAAPALDAATRLTGDPQAAAGYAFGYPIGVLVGIVVVTMTVTRAWRGEKDTPSLAGVSLETVTVRVADTVSTRQITAWRDQRVRMSYLRRDGGTRVVVPGEDLLAGDLVLLVGEPADIAEAARQIGEPVTDRRLEDDRSDVAFERILVSNPDLAGRSITSLNVTARFGAVVTRVRRGDLDLLARDDLDLQLGDQLGVVVPIEELEAIQSWLGDSARRVLEVDAMSFGIGLVLGMLLGAIPFPVAPGTSFQLGSAAGPLIVGMLLGAVRRTGPIVWSLPLAANLTIRQIGLLLFLAALGLNAGPDVAGILTGPLGLKAALLALVITVCCCLAQVAGAKAAGLSAPRAAGGVAGFLGQPAVVQAADARVADERIEGAYATLFAFSIIVKILLVPLFTVL